MKKEDRPVPNRIAAGVPSIVALVITQSITGWSDWRVVLVAIPAVAILVALVALVMWTTMPGTREAGYWYEFAVIYLWGCAALAVIALFAWLNGYHGIGSGTLIVIAAVVASGGWLVFDIIRKRRRRKPGTPHPLKPLPPVARAERTDHHVRITAKGRGKDRQVLAECQDCEWRQRQSGRGDWPDRRIARYVAAHTTWKSP